MLCWYLAWLYSIVYLINPFKILRGLRCNFLALGRVNCRFCIAIIAVFCTLETFRSEALLKAKCKTQCITFRLLICTLISEVEVFKNQGLLQTLEKMSGSANLLDFFQVWHLEFLRVVNQKKNQGLQNLKFLQGLQQTPISETRVQIKTPHVLNQLMIQQRFC